jgi:2-amino-4-hydroxy-6-hydroxymethyldihydropteridine diphosphokinase
MEHTAYIGLGSNLGPRRKTLRRALAALDERADARVRRVSRFIETDPVGGPPQGRFLNAAAELETDLPPGGLLAVLQQVEEQFGRERGTRWGPRTLDLDILLYDDAVVDEPDLKIPHPLMQERRFVLEPLCQIAPELVHPVLNKTVADLLSALDAPRDA